jgi:predicted enzyme related to lactoylglutathione lyase
MDHVGIVVGDWQPRLRSSSSSALSCSHLAFAADDIDAIVARVRSRGGELVGEVEN